MKTPRKLRPFSFVLLSLTAITVIGVVAARLRGSGDASVPQTVAVSPESLRNAEASTGDTPHARAPKLAVSTMNTIRRAELAEAADQQEVAAIQTDRDRFFAEERRIMAKAWGLSPEKAADFEIAVRDGFADRKALFDRISRGKVSADEMEGQLKAFHEKARTRLVEAIGLERLVEFEMTNGHFVELGLDHKPFVAPHAVSLEVAEQAAATGAPPAVLGDPVPLPGAWHDPS